MPQPRKRARNVALVLGSGGPVGHAYHAGVLKALRRALDWDPRHADLIVGTSAGAQVAALLRAGMSAEDLAARAAGEPLSSDGAAIARHYVRPSHEKPPADGTTTKWPASPQYIAQTLRRPWRVKPTRFVSALLSEGRVSLKPQADGFHALFGDDWPQDDLWITAVDVASGEVVAFGSEDAPRTDVGTAVIASGAVPGVCAPVTVGERHFVDGGIASATHLDLLLHRPEIDTVIVSNPLSFIPPMRYMLRCEVKRLIRAGLRVITFEPSANVARVMRWNPMDTTRSPEIVHAAYQATFSELRGSEREADAAALVQPA